MWPDGEFGPTGENARHRLRPGRAPGSGLSSRAKRRVRRVQDHGFHRKGLIVGWEIRTIERIAGLDHTPRRLIAHERRGTKLVGARRCSPPSPGGGGTYQSACKPGSVGAVRCAPRGTAIPLGRRLPGASSNLPGRRSGHRSEDLRSRAAPIRSCSRWGLPCRFRCRNRGALLPHRFTLTAANTQRAAAVCFLWHFPWGLPPPDVIRHRMSMEPGLSSLATFRAAGAAVQPTDRLGMGRGGVSVKGRWFRRLSQHRFLLIITGI